ncbi:hypothetical protein [Deinococcus sp.]|uniref:hypothetical protein n=1 Tax=Deinococcus sp. TaxID=47478 RepID=UPI002869D073|nr:hypothetical protein [Deinococcus sp.]
MTTSLHLSWVPGTIDRVRFEHQGRTFTVFLRDVQRGGSHSLGALYLKGRVRLRVTKLHHAQLIGPLAHSVTDTPARSSTAPFPADPPDE